MPLGRLPPSTSDRASSARSAGPFVDAALADQGLSAVGIDLHHTARIGRPDRAVGLAEDALGALQINAQTADVTPIDLPAKEWIEGGAHGL
jgi:hypothetical protein